MARQTSMINISEDRLRAIIEDACRDAVRSELEQAGLLIDEPGDREEAREDFRFVRRLRLRFDRTGNAIGNAVLLALGTLVVALMALAGKAMGLRWPQ
jgi:hypothetical protein